MDPYLDARNKLTDFLVRATLIESYHSFAQHGKPYPFVTPEALLPRSSGRATEHPFQRAALIFLVDGVVPRALRKHIRFRPANEVSAQNITRLAPDIDVRAFNAGDCAVDAAGFAPFLDKLIDLDFGLLIQREGEAAAGPSEPPRLTHMHVKVERLTDNAVRALAIALGYIKRRLYEQGDDYVEALEQKYHEYFGFSGNASGRKSAAAMAGQLLATGDQRFTVFVTSQEDCRLTLIDDTDDIQQFLLVALAPKTLDEISGGRADDYSIGAIKAGDEPLRKVVILRVRFGRTGAAQQVNGEGIERDPADLSLRWLALKGETIMPAPESGGAEIAFSWTTKPSV